MHRPGPLRADMAPHRVGAGSKDTNPPAINTVNYLMHMI